MSATMLGAAFRDQGFVPTGAAAARGAGDMPFEGPLKPGDARRRHVRQRRSCCSAAPAPSPTSTATSVYAFGHPMYNLGPTEFPMTRAYVYTVLPSLFSSTKLSTTGEVIGTLLQDRATTIAGRLGPGPR